MFGRAGCIAANAVYVKEAVTWKFGARTPHTYTRTGFSIEPLYEMTCSEDIPIFRSTIDCLFDSAVDDDDDDDSDGSGGDGNDGGAISLAYEVHECF